VGINDIVHKENTMKTRYENKHSGIPPGATIGCNGAASRFRGIANQEDRSIGDNYVNMLQM